MNTETTNTKTIYTQEELLALPLRALDAVVAETVMGYRRMWDFENDNHLVLVYGGSIQMNATLREEQCNGGCVVGPHSYDNVPAYSTSMDAAWTVAEEMNRNAYFGMACSFPSSEKEHEFLFKKRNVGEWDIWALTMPIAICVAAVLAVQGGNQNDH